MCTGWTMHRGTAGGAAERRAGRGEARCGGSAFACTKDRMMIKASRRGQLLHEMQFEISRPPGLGACCYSETQTRNPDSSIFYRFPDSRAWSRIQNRNLRESSVRISEHADDSGRRFQHLVRFSVNAEDSGRKFMT
jgi:hypothetical protein